MTERDIGNWTHYVLLTDGTRIGVNPHGYPFKPEHWKYFHPNKRDTS